MFNVGGPEILVIFLVALVILGPQQLPKAMRTFGSVMSEVRKVSSSFQSEMRSAMDSVVDVSGDEKPQSGTMATPAKPLTQAGDSTVVSDPETEVVARNDGASVDDDLSPSDEAGSDVDGVVDERPAIDPADRAAG